MLLICFHESQKQGAAIYNMKHKRSDPHGYAHAPQPTTSNPLRLSNDPQPLSTDQAPNPQPPNQPHIDIRYIMKSYVN